MTTKEDKLQTLEKIKSKIKELEKEDTIKDVEQKKNQTATVLKATLEMININSKEKLSNISENIREWIENTKIEMEITQNAIEHLTQSTNSDKERKQNFSEKQHIFRESDLSIMFAKDKNFKSLYFMFVTFFCWLFLSVTMNSYKTNGVIIDFEFWRENFVGLQLTIIIWISLYLYSTFIIFFVCFINLFAKKNGYIPYYIVFLIYFIYQAMIYSITFLTGKVSFTCGCIIGCEMARFSLKIHSYFREKMLYGLKDFHMDYAAFSPIRSKDGNAKSEILDINIKDFFTEFRRFNYFIFCPSLIYRDNYPRITNRRYKKILVHLTNFILCILCYYAIVRFVCEPYMQQSRLKDYYSFSMFMLESARLTIPCVGFLLVGFFLFLHTWLNLWAELLRHGDRRFYEDWWNSTNFEVYYRKWNMVVHEWLYYYIYNDIIRLSLGKLNRLHAKFTVFIISVIVHEIIIWVAIGFFFPILSIFFGGPGIIFTYIKSKGKKFNLMFWIKMFTGPGFIFLSYLRELKSRAVLDGLGLVHGWHQWMPRMLLIYFEPYKSMLNTTPYY
jgi:sterol O-acyltransferase